MNRSKKLLDSHLDDTIPDALYRDEQTRINRELAVIAERLASLRTEFETLERNLDDAIALSESCYEAYVRAPDALRRTYNQAFFKRILITREESIQGELAEPFATIVTVTEMNSGATPEGAAPLLSGSYKVMCSKETDLVDLMRRSSNTRPRTKRLVRAVRQMRKASVVEQRSDGRAGVVDERGQIADVPSVRPLSESEIADAIDRFRRGELIQSIAVRLGVNRKRIRTVFQARGVTSKRSPLTMDQVERAAELYRGGLSLAAVGTEFGVTGMTIRRYLSEHGVKIRPRQGWENRGDDEESD